MRMGRYSYRLSCRRESGTSSITVISRCASLLLDARLAGDDIMNHAPVVLALALHMLGAVVWVGGMFAAYLCLRPAAGSLEAPQRLRLWRGFFQQILPLGVGFGGAAARPAATGW